MKKGFIVANIILAIVCVVLDIFYIIEGGLLLKSITSLVFVLIGLTNLVYAIITKSSSLKYCIVMAIGLTFAMSGDIVLEIFFIGGAGLFAVGHIFYFVAYSTMQKFRIKDFIPTLCIFIPCFILLLMPIFDFGGVVMHIVCIAYAAIISCMVGKSISNFVHDKTNLNLIILVGSVLFCFSDLALVFNLFSEVIPSLVGTILCLGTYYPAECILAYSILHSSKN